MSDIFQFPPLLYIFCAMSAMAFVISAGLWMRKAYRTEGDVGSDFTSAIWQGQKYSVFVVMIISTVFALYSFLVLDILIHIWGEITILLIGVYLVSKSGDTLPRIKKVFSFGCFCLVGWGLTIAVGYALGVLLSFIPTFSDQDFGIAIVFVTGLLWNVPILYWGHKMLIDTNKISALKGKSPYTYLWPVMFAYLVLLLPLLLQMVASSDEWADMKKPKAVKEVEIKNYSIVSFV